jgi:hypothetical protein
VNGGGHRQSVLDIRKMYKTLIFSCTSLVRHNKTTQMYKQAQCTLYNVYFFIYQNGIAFSLRKIMNFLPLVFIEAGNYKVFDDHTGFLKTPSFKGSLTRDFRPQVFHESFFPGPLSIPLGLDYLINQKR